MGKILLVEDDNNLREIYGARLQAEGHEIISARDGEEALAVAVKEKPDLIIADIMMPRVSGFDMLDILRNAPETKNTKIIMMTALSQHEDKQHAEKLGADKYLVKSQVTLEDVAKVVRETLAGDQASVKPDSGKSEEPKPELIKPADPPKQAEPPAPAAPPTPPAPPAPATLPAESATPPPITSTPPPPAPAPATPPTPPKPADGKPADDKPAASSQPAQPKPSMGTPPPSNDNKPAPSPSVSIPVVVPAQDDSPVKKDDPPVQTSSPVKPPKEDSAKQGEVSAVKPAGAPKKDEPATKPANDEAQDAAAKIGPNLAQALADEEKQIKNQIKDFEKSKDTPAAGQTKPDEPQVISPAKDKDKPKVQEPENSDEKDDKEAEQSEVAKAGPTVTDGSANPRKVIQPINDLSKKPDLEALAAEEKGIGKVINQPQNIFKPQTTSQPDESAQTSSEEAPAGKDNKPHPKDISI